MDREKLKVFLGLHKQAPTQEQRLLQAQAEKMGQEAAIMRDLVKHRGWKLLDEFFTRKQAVLTQELKTCKAKDLVKLQEKSKIIDEFRAFVTSKIIRDPDL